MILIVTTLFEKLNFELHMTTKLKSYIERQERLKDIVKEEDIFMYGGREAGKLGQAVCVNICIQSCLFPN